MAITPSRQVKRLYCEANMGEMGFAKIKSNSYGSGQNYVYVNCILDYSQRI